MKNNEIVINQTVAILCDGNNIERSIQEEANRNVMVNFDHLIPRLLNGRGLNRFIYFREGKHISDKLAERLYTKYYGSVVPCHKSADIPLSIKATQLASKVDTIIILSGDSDYVELVRHLKSEGVRVEIAAVRKTSARILLEEADHFVPITQADWFSYNKPGSSGRQRFSPQRNQSSSSVAVRSPSMPVPSSSAPKAVVPVSSQQKTVVKVSTAPKSVVSTSTKAVTTKKHASSAYDKSKPAVAHVKSTVTKSPVKKSTPKSAVQRLKSKLFAKSSTTSKTKTKPSVKKATISSKKVPTSTKK